MTSFARRAMCCARVVLALAALATISGCGGGASYEGPERAEVSGSVTLDGTPLPYGAIVFRSSVGGQRQASGVIQNGSYSIEEATLSVEGPLDDEIPVDSLAIVSFAVFLEEEFEIRLQRADLNRQTFHSISTVAEYVADRMRR